MMFGASYYIDTGIAVGPGSAHEFYKVFAMAWSTGEPVCEIIGGNPYTKLETALDAVTDGQTIRLLKDIDHSQGITITGKSITFDLYEHQLDVENASGDGLEVGSGGTLSLKGEGSFNVTGSGHGVYAHDGGSASVTTAGSTGTSSAQAESGGTIHVAGDVTGYSGVFASGTDSRIEIQGSVTGTNKNSSGAWASAGGVIEVTGDVTGGIYGAIAAGNDSSVDVGGTATATNGSGVQAENGGSVTASGAVGTVYGVAATSGSSVIITGDVSSPGIGAAAFGGSEITINGTLDAPTYIKVGSQTKTKDDYTTPTTLYGHYTYTDNGSPANTVWVAEGSSDTDISGDFIDPNFKQAVWEWLGNSGGTISFTKQDLIDRIPAEEYKLDVQYKSISSLAGLEHFQGTGIQILLCNDNDLVTLPDLPDTLVELDCEYNGLTVLPNLPGSLENLDCENNQLTSLPDLPENLKILECGDNPNWSGYLPALPGGLLILDCDDIGLTMLPALPAGLEELDCGWNPLTSLPELPGGLEWLYCSRSRLTTLPDLPESLLEFECEKNALNVFSDPLLTMINNCPAKEKMITPQCRIHYPGTGLDLEPGKTYQIVPGDLRMQESFDGVNWKDFDFGVVSEFSFMSSDTSVATVNTLGLVTGQGKGNASIFADFLGIDSVFTRVIIPVGVTSPSPGGGGGGGGGHSSKEEVTVVPEEVPLAPALVIVLTPGSNTALVNGQETLLDRAPFIQEDSGRAMVPIRFVSEHLGAKVEWLKEPRQVRIVDNGRTIILTRGSNQVLVNGVALEKIDCPPEIAGGRTFVPLRFVSETLGANIEWDQDNKKITITKLVPVDQTQE